MLDWIGDIGPFTWAMIGLYLLLLLGMFLLSRGHVVTLVGVLLVVASSATMVQIFFYRGTRDPILDLPIAITTALAVMIALGFGFIAGRHKNSSQDSPGLRTRVPQFSGATVSGLVIGAVLLFAAGSVVVNRMDLPSNNANSGFEIAREGASLQATRTLQIIERFLAR